MTMTLVWTGVAFWLGLNAAIAARCVHIARAKIRVSSVRIVRLDHRRA